MCVVALAIGAHPKWPLLLIGNRDEFHARPSAPLNRWGKVGAAQHHIIGGRDLQSGGSWLGVSEQGRLAVVTNVSGGQPPDLGKASRGALIADFLRGDGRYANLQTTDLHDFNGFHLLKVSHNASAIQATNRPNTYQRAIPTGVHALANEERAAPCSRRDRLGRQFSAWLSCADEAVDPSDLLDLLRREEQGGEAGRPNFLNGDVYGTRCSTIVAVDREGNGKIIERRFGPLGTEQGETMFEFCWGQ